MNRRELVAFFASVPALAALAGQIKAEGSVAASGEDLGAVGTKLLFENDSVKVWEFALEPGEAIPMHTHTYDYLFHVYQGSTLEVSFPNNQPKATVTLKEGDVRFIPKGGRHTAKNVGEKRYVEVLVELKK